MSWDGELRIDAPGRYALQIEAPGSVRVFLDGAELGQGRPHRHRRRGFTLEGVELDTGWHSFALVVDPGGRSGGPVVVSFDAAADGNLDLPASRVRFPAAGGLDRRVSRSHGHGQDEGVQSFDRDALGFAALRPPVAAPGPGRGHAVDLDWSGYIHIEAAGLYRFELVSSHEAELAIGPLTASSPGAGTAYADAVTFEPGWHPVNARLRNALGPVQLEVRFAADAVVHAGEPIDPRLLGTHCGGTCAPPFHEVVP